jgi:hypothetical protein
MIEDARMQCYDIVGGEDEDEEEEGVELEVAVLSVCEVESVPEEEESADEGGGRLRAGTRRKLTYLTSRKMPLCVC